MSFLYNLIQKICAILSLYPAAPLGPSINTKDLHPICTMSPAPRCGNNIKQCALDASLLRALDSDPPPLPFTTKLLQELAHDAHSDLPCKTLFYEVLNTLFYRATDRQYPCRTNDATLTLNDLNNTYKVNDGVAIQKFCPRCDAQVGTPHKAISNTEIYNLVAYLCKHNPLYTNLLGSFTFPLADLTERAPNFHSEQLQRVVPLFRILVQSGHDVDAPLFVPNQDQHTTPLHHACTAHYPTIQVSEYRHACPKVARELLCLHANPNALDSYNRNVLHAIDQHIHSLTDLYYLPWRELKIPDKKILLPLRKTLACGALVALAQGVRTICYDTGRFDEDDVEMWQRRILDFVDCEERKDDKGNDVSFSWVLLPPQIEDAEALCPKKD